MFKAAKRFILNQRKEELEKAIRHWANSDKLEQRKEELEDVRRQLKELDPE